MVGEIPVYPTPSLASQNDEDDEDDRKDPEDTPETPLDEPQPPRVDDPPAEPDQRGPFVVSAW
jgi:hypothetical protein